MPLSFSEEVPLMDRKVEEPQLFHDLWAGMPLLVAAVVVVLPAL